MSRISFDTIAEQQPAMRDAIRALAGWVAERRGVRFIELGRIAADLRSVPPDALVVALYALADAGLVRQAFRLRDPSGEFLDDIYHDEHEVPLGWTPTADGRGEFTATPANVVEGWEVLRASRARP